jgi:hypothetical protein
MQFKPFAVPALPVGACFSIFILTPSLAVCLTPRPGEVAPQNLSPTNERTLIMHAWQVSGTARLRQMLRDNVILRYDNNTQEYWQQGLVL